MKVLLLAPEDAYLPVLGAVRAAAGFAAANITPTRDQPGPVSSSPNSTGATLEGQHQSEVAVIGPGLAFSGPIKVRDA